MGTVIGLSVLAAWFAFLVTAICIERCEASEKERAEQRGFEVVNHGLK